MEYLKKLLEKRWFSYTIAACSAVILYMVMSRFQVVLGLFNGAVSFISPVITGVVFAWLMNPMTVFLEKRLEKSIKKEALCHSVSVILAVLCTVLAVALIIVAVVPSVVSNFVSLAANSDSYLTMMDKYLTDLQSLGQSFGLNIDDLTQSLEGLVKNIMNILPQSLGAIWKTSVSVGSTMANVLISFVIAIYLLMDKKRILAAADRLRKAFLSKKAYQRNTAFWEHCNHVFIRYISCNLVDAVIIGAANAVFMLIFRMPYVALLSVLVGVTNLLPTVGPIIGAVIGAFILVINKPVMALWFLIFTMILQTLDGYVIKPKLFGASLGIPSVLTLISIILGGKLCGIPGILLAIPVVSILCDLYNDSFLPWLEKRRNAS